MNVYEIVTERILETMSKGEIPWRKPWGIAGQPINYASKKKYKGINTLLLHCARSSTPYWLTLKQANELGGSVKAGSKGMPVVFFKWMEKENSEGKTEEFPCLRYYTVFNADQLTGIDFPELKNNRVFNPIEEAERIINEMPKRPTMQSIDGSAYYSPAKDLINLPDKGLFKSEAGYYETAFHELAHSTGHETRLNRKQKAEDCRFGSTSYAKEELIAELTAAFLCNESNLLLETLDNNAAYLQSWMKALQNDQRMIVMAAGQAQKAADFILNKKEEVTI